MNILYIVKILCQDPALTALSGVSTKYAKVTGTICNLLVIVVKMYLRFLLFLFLTTAGSFINSKGVQSGPT